MSATRNHLFPSGRDEPVEVNQRALIDKVLSRYSGEFTVFRELLQNSDDAQATAAEIHFETHEFTSQKNKQFSFKRSGSGSHDFPDLETLPVHQWVFKNNGTLFRDEDWSRLKKIAEGNPNEEKIGAFGVGFYSLFSVTEEPFVTSGDQWMCFYWKDKKDQLFVRRGNTPGGANNPQSVWTSFEMPLREAAPIPVAFDLTQFLAASLTFMTNLKEVSVYLDDKRLSCLKKSSNSSMDVSIPHDMKSFSPLRMMNVTSVKATSLEIKAEVMQGVYPTKRQSSALRSGPRGLTFKIRKPSFSLVGGKGPLTVTTPSIALMVYSVEVDTHLDDKLTQELHRAMMKNPPRKLRYELIYTEKDSYDASMREDNQQQYVYGSLFQGLRADLEGRGLSRIFIGHSTAQTTGLAGHMASRFIPTVERESIDLVDRHVAVWNKELLYVGGFLARLVYELELDDVQKLWMGEKPPANNQAMNTPSLNRALHNLKFFAFHTSTPSSDVSCLIEEAFFSCAPKRPLLIASTAGICSVAMVRFPDPKLSGFIKGLPVLPQESLIEAKAMVDCMETRGMITKITCSEILTELRSRPLNEQEMIACLTWWVDQDRNYDIPRQVFLDAASMIARTPGTETTLPMSSVQTFISPQSSIITDGPLPNHVLPHQVSKAFQPVALSASFPWTQLSVIKWLRHLVSLEIRSSATEYDIGQSTPWARRVLLSLGSSWWKMSTAMQDEVVTLLKDVNCIPTSQGIVPPPMAYLAQVDQFSDLPIVDLGCHIKASMGRFLCNLGIRKHVDLKLMVDRIANTGNWTTSDLTKYLVNMDTSSRLSIAEIEYLRTCAIFTAEKSITVRHCACELYQPTDVHRRLGLSIVDWEAHMKWRDNSKHAQFLYQLGLHKFPPLNVIIELAAGSDPTVRQVAFQCLLDDMYKNYNDYDRKDFDNKKFVPASEGLTIRMASPNEVFVRPDWALLGFLTVPPCIVDDALMKLKISENPPPSMLITLLETRPPADVAQAQKWFNLLSSQISEFSDQDFEYLSNLPIVPMRLAADKGGGSIHLKPRECYIGAPPSARLHAEMFAFVDFGLAANRFLAACWSKQEPSVEDIALRLLSDPWKFYDDRESFLDELRNIAHNIRSISRQTIEKMRQTPFLLSSRRQSSTAIDKEASQSFMDDKNKFECVQDDLRRPNQILIEDDSNLYQLFGDSIFIAPQESKLEDFYMKLGSRLLSTVVRKECAPSNEIGLSQAASDIRSLILERLPLFLHDHPNRTKDSAYSCFKDGEKFFVKVFEHLSLSMILDYGEHHLRQEQTLSAFAVHVEKTHVQLWLTADMEVDMYDVASGLVPLLLKTPKTGDIVLFETILTTSLQRLKKRGYNVDRILRQQREKQSADSKHTPRVIRPPAATAQEPTSWTHSSFYSHITSRINSAIETCAAGHSNLRQNTQGERNTSQPINYGYCDVSGNIDLASVDDMNGVKFYTCQSGNSDHLRGGSFMSTIGPRRLFSIMESVLEQFLSKIILPLCKVYDIPYTCIHVFYQAEGNLIAFNRNGNIFLNLRCYEALHESDVDCGSLSEAYISWYFTLAHELAHNEVQSHDLEHELIFSALCEKHILDLGRLLLPTILKLSSQVGDDSQVPIQVDPDPQSPHFS